MNVLKAIVQAFKAEFGKFANSNPWPRCGACYRRTDPAGMCHHELHGQSVCIADCNYAGAHPEERDEQ